MSNLEQHCAQTAKVYMHTKVVYRKTLTQNLYRHLWTYTDTKTHRITDRQMHSCMDTQVYTCKGHRYTSTQVYSKTDTQMTRQTRGANYVLHRVQLLGEAPLYDASNPECLGCLSTNNMLPRGRRTVFTASEFSLLSSVLHLTWEAVHDAFK
jgi:hypothetical protein